MIVLDVIRRRGRRESSSATADTEKVRHLEAVWTTNWSDILGRASASGMSRTLKQVPISWTASQRPSSASGAISTTRVMSLRLP